MVGGVSVRCGYGDEGKHHERVEDWRSGVSLSASFRHGEVSLGIDDACGAGGKRSGDCHGGFATSRSDVR